MFTAPSTDIAQKEKLLGDGGFTAPQKEVNRKMSIGQKMDLAGFAASKVSGMAPWNMASQGLKDIAGATAEKMGGAGIPPKVAANVMFPLAMFPDLLAAGTSLGALEGSSLPARAIQNTPKMLGEQYQFQNKAAGVLGEMPVRSGRLPGFEKSSADLGDMETAKNLALNSPVSYPKDPGAFFNLAKNRMSAFGKDLMVDEVMTYKDSLGQMLDKGAKKVNQLLGRNTGYAEVAALNKVATKLENQVVDQGLLGKAIPRGYETSRGGLNELNSLSRKLHPDILGFINQNRKTLGISATALALEEFIRRKLFAK